jgi:hypothetical protein
MRTPPRLHRVWRAPECECAGSPSSTTSHRTNKQTHAHTRARMCAHISARTRTRRHQGTAGRGSRPSCRRTRRTRIPPHTPPSGAVGDSVGDAERRVPAGAQHGCAQNSPWTRSRPCAMVAVRMLVTVRLFVRFLACLCCRRGGGRGAPRRPSRPADRPAGVAALAPPVTFRGEGSDPSGADPTLACALQVHCPRKLGRGRQAGRERYRACSIVR